MTNPKAIHDAEQGVTAARNFGAQVAAFYSELRLKMDRRDAVQIAAHYVLGFWTSMRRPTEPDEK